MTATGMKLPGGEMSSRPLHFIWMCDCSGSMYGEKIKALNTAIRNCIPEMVKAAAENPEAQVFVRVLTFSDGATWHISTPTPVEQFAQAWTDLEADGVTSMGKALSMVAEQLKMPPMSSRALPPVVVLVSDGQPTDDFARGLKDFMDQPWGKKTVRLSIAIGNDADKDVLQRFIGIPASGNPEIKPMEAHNPEQLMKYVRWLSTTMLSAASKSKVTLNIAAPNDAGSPVALPPSPVIASGAAQDDVW